MKFPALPVLPVLLTVLMSWSSLSLAADTLKFEADSFWTRFEGSWQIDRVDKQHVITFAQDFDAKKAPDLKIFLSKKAYGDLTGKNAADADPVLIAPLTTYKGTVSVVIPEDIDLDDYQSIIVHCEAYEKLWGGSPLRQ